MPSGWIYNKAQNQKNVENLLINLLLRVNKCIFARAHLSIWKKEIERRLTKMLSVFCFLEYFIEFSFYFYLSLV